MNELGVDFDVISEQATRHAENGDPVYWITMQTKTRNGDKLMFLYEADLTIRWLNLDNDDETIEATVHAVGWNDDPAKAKGAAHTYALKYYLSRSSPSTKARTTPTTVTSARRARIRRWRPPAGRTGPSGAELRPSERRAARAPLQEGRGRRNDQGAHQRPDRGEVQKQDPATLTRQEYDEICTSLDNAAAQHNQQGGNA